jgi:hypothetical protein
MLTLFTNITEQLTEFEKNTLVPMLLETLKHTHIGNRYKGKDICTWFDACRCEVSEARLRKMVNYVRVTNAAKPQVLIGTSTGYFLTDSVSIVNDQIESLEGRIDSMRAVVDSLKAQKQNLQRSE